MTPRLAKIRTYPVKSLDPVEVDEATLLSSGALDWDRRFALCDQRGHFINGKSTASIHRLRSSYDLAAGRVTLAVEGSETTYSFDLTTEPGALTSWLSEFFGQPVTLIENADAGLPDDIESPGPTLVSTATLASVAEWFSLPMEDVRRRFRVNLEIDGVPPFWEDQLAASDTRTVHFRTGDAELLGTNPCQRCVVPTRSPTTGQVTHEFAKTFARLREQSLPEWAPRDRFNHFYRLSVNTRSAGSRQSKLRVGDELRILAD